MTRGYGRKVVWIDVPVGIEIDRYFIPQVYESLGNRFCSNMTLMISMTQWTENGCDAIEPFAARTLPELLEKR